MDDREPTLDLLRALLVSPETAELLARHGLSVQFELRDAQGAAPNGEALAAVQAELARAREQLEHARRLAGAGELAAGITHEARNLLTGTLGFAQLLQKQPHDPQRVTSMAATIEAETRRCVDILASFLKLSRSGMEAVRPMDVGELVGSVERLVSQPLHERGCTLAVAAEEELPQVVGRSGELQRVLINLILNAADAAQSGGHVLLTATSAADGAVELSVSDDGPGVPEALAERIFEPFFSTKTAGEGTGLGLSLSRSIVEAHGGRLYLDRSATTGATFTLRLPAARPSQPDPAPP